VRRLTLKLQDTRVSEAAIRSALTRVSELKGRNARDVEGFDEAVETFHRKVRELEDGDLVT
jgi:hypothetical protein